MNVNTSIGAKIKQCRTEKKMTLKQLGEQTGLSVGFLSQFERGLSSIALDSLEKIARVLETPLSELFEEHVLSAFSDPVIHSMDLHFDSVNEHTFQSVLKNNCADFQMTPKIYTLLPVPDDTSVPEMMSHEGEQFVYVLEGVVTLFSDSKVFVLYAGDSIHMDCKKEHGWINRSTRTAKILTVSLSPQKG